MRGESVRRRVRHILSLTLRLLREGSISRNRHERPLGGWSLWDQRVAAPQLPAEPMPFPPISLRRSYAGHCSPGHTSNPDETRAGLHRLVTSNMVLTMSGLTEFHHRD